MALSPRSRLLVSLTLAVALASCGGDDGEEPNLLPTASATDSNGDDDGMTNTSADDDDGSTVDDTSADDGGTGVMLPVTYRFDCMDIRILGDSDEDGEGDGLAFQTNVLESTWNSDVDNYKLNILLTVKERDDAAGTATIQVASGIGTGDADQCAEPTTQQPDRAAGFEVGVATWGDGGAACSAEGNEGAGTYTFSLGPADVVYVYAEDDDGTPFNCVPGGASPNAVPVRAVEATVTVSANESVGYGELTGCLTAAEAGGLCSCIGACMGNEHPMCPGCPGGAVPLADQLAGIGPTNRCSTIMGEDAFDLVIGFLTTQLPNNPDVCAG